MNKSFVLTLLFAATVRADCTCLETEENGLPPQSFFEGEGYPAEYGSTCSDWDAEDESCQEGGDNYGVAWCTEDWCYVSTKNTCDEDGVFDTVMFADDPTYSETLKFATQACEETEEASSVAVYASALAVTAAMVAASV